MAKRPTTQQTEDARAYIRRRLDAEQSMSLHLKEELDAAADEIVDICLRYGTEPKSLRFASNPGMKKEIDTVISALISVLMEDAEILSVAEREDEDGILAYVRRENYGKTLLQRITDYTGMFSTELEAAIAAGLWLSLSASKIKQQIHSNLMTPYLNPSIRAARTAGGFKAEGIEDRSLGASAFHALELATTQIISDTWMHLWHKEAREKGSIGFWSERSSSYPCELCDSMVGFHEWSEPQPPYHPRCVCTSIPVYE